MTETIIPAFKDAPNEALLVGRLLSGYSELELEMWNTVHLVTGDIDRAIRQLYGERGEKRRITNARKLAESSFGLVGLGQQYSSTMDDMDWCRTLRNQYAHCAWYYTSREGLCFTDLEDLAKKPQKIEALTYIKFPVDVPLLASQEAFFKNVQKRFWWLCEQYPILTGQVARSSSLLWSWPSTMGQPREHN
jgi:hypothetical protein